jgi:hypothetical protein
MATPYSELTTIDPKGDTIITLFKSFENQRQEQPLQCEEPAGSATDPAKTTEVGRFLVSSIHLRSASLYFETMFQGGFQEATPSVNDGRFHISAHDLNADAMCIVMSIIHARARNIPRTIDIETYIGIEILIDYYQIKDAVTFHTDIWQAQLGNAKNCTRYSPETIRWLFLAWKTRNWDDFEFLAMIVMTKAEGKIDFQDLPFPADIKGICVRVSFVPPRSSSVAKLDDRRYNAIDQLLKQTRSLKNRLIEGSEGCSEACNAMLLGSLLRELQRTDMLKRVDGYKNAAEGVSFAQLLNVIESVETFSWRETSES